MSIRFDAATDRITAPGPAGSAVTITCWANIATDRDNYSNIWLLYNANEGFPEAGLGSSADGTSMVLYDAGFATQASQAMTVGTWYALAAVMNGTAWASYFGTDPASLASNTATRTTLSSPANLVLSSAGDWFNGRIAHFRMWERALSGAEVAAELASASPVSATNLIRSHSFASGTNLVPDAGSGGTFTAGGTATTTEADPPLSAPASLALLLPRRPRLGALLDM